MTVTALVGQKDDKAPKLQYRISPKNRDRLKELKVQLNFRSLDSVLSHLLRQNSSYYPPPESKLVESPVPSIITGLPNAGKSTFLKSLVGADHGPCLVLDIANEYPLAKVNLGDVFGLEWQKERRKLRFVPNESVDVSRTEADAIFRHLIMFQRELAQWLIVVEEGHRFKDSDFLKSFMAEARKFTRKLIVVSHQPESFRGLGEIYKVIPWTGASQQ